MTSNRISPNQREILSAQSTITGKQEYLLSTSGVLQTSATIGGTTIPISGATTGVGVAILDGSGNQITSFGGGTQYTDGGVPPAHPVAGTLEWSDGSNWQTVSTAKPLPTTITGTITVNANAGTNLNTSLLALETGGNLATIATNTATPTSIFNGKTTVTTAGTRVVLASSQAVKSVTIKALAANTGVIYVGNTSVSASNGFQLAAGDTVSIDLTNLNTVNIDSSVNSEGVSYIGIN